MRFRSHKPHNPPHLGDSVHRIKQVWVAGSHLCLRLSSRLLVLLALPKYLNQRNCLAPQDLLLMIQNLNWRLLVRDPLEPG